MHGACETATHWISTLSLWSGLSLLSLLSLGSVGSLASVGSVASVASVGSFLSVGSYRSFLSIGCVDSYFSICGRHADAGSADAGLLTAPTDSTLVLEEVQHEADHDASSLGCTDDDMVVVRNRGSAAVNVGNWKVFIFGETDEHDFATTPAHTFAAATVAAGGTAVWCADDEISKYDVVILVDPAGVRQSAAVMPKFYTWREGRADDYLEVHHVTVVVPDAEWQTMAECSLEDKRSGADTPGDRCGYKPATCTLNHGSPMPCEVKRKGNGSWRPMDQNPALKLKLDPDSDADHPYQRKLVLNNMVGDPSNGAEITSYGVFAKFGLPASRANHAMVTLQREGAPAATPTLYTSVEPIDTPEFLAAHGLDDYAVWEYEKNHLEHKEMGMNFDIEGELEHAAESGDLKRIWQRVDKMAMFRYYAAEVATAHWDGMCRRLQPTEFAHNVHVLRSPEGKYLFVPWGLDNTNTCFNSREAPTPFVGPFNMYMGINDRLLPVHVASCNIMRTCFENADCQAEYDQVAADLDALPGVQVDRCAVPGLFWRLTAMILYSVVLVTLLTLALWAPAARAWAWVTATSAPSARSARSGTTEYFMLF